MTPKTSGQVKTHGVTGGGQDRDFCVLSLSVYVCLFVSICVCLRERCQVSLQQKNYIW